MKQNRNILFPALSALGFLAFASRGEAPTYHPEEGTVLQKDIAIVSEITLDDMTMVMNGQEMDADMLGMEMTTRAKTTVVVKDTYVAMGEGQPSKLRREFVELGSFTEVSVSNQMMGDSDQEMEGTSELEGLSVVFTWDDDESDYTVEFAEDSDGDDELLEGLNENLDLRGMLPDGEVSEGDTWDVEPEVLLEVFAPGGAVKIQPEELDQMLSMNAPTPSPDQMLGDFEGDVTAAFEGVREEGDVRVAVINLTIDVSSAKDMTEFMEEMMAAMEMPEGMEIEMDIESMDMEFAFEGEGTLLWNLETGLIFGLTLEGEVDQAMDTSMNMAMGEMEQSIEQSMSLSGSQTVTITTE